MKIKKYVNGKLVLEDGRKIPFPTSLDPKKLVGKDMEEIQAILDRE